MKCIHNITKYYCKVCSPHNFCECDKFKNRCLIHHTKKTLICIHNKRKDQCIECSGCIHNKRKSRCEICSPHKLCQHNILRENCFECGGRSKCKHNIRLDRCVSCSPNTKELCSSCRLFIVFKKNNYLCSYCNPIKSSYTKTKENRVKELLEQHNIKFINNKTFENDCCLKYRPDFIVDCNTYYIILECDEDAHNSYDKECEIIRMNNISTGLGLPCKWIRYNPDQRSVSQEIKERTLIDTIQQCSNLDFIEDLEVVYLFY